MGIQSVRPASRTALADRHARPHLLLVIDHPSISVKAHSSLTPSLWVSQEGLSPERLSSNGAISAAVAAPLTRDWSIQLGGMMMRRIDAARLSFPLLRSERVRLQAGPRTGAFVLLCVPARRLAASHRTCLLPWAINEVPREWRSSRCRGK